MKGILGMLLLLMIIVSVEVNILVNDIILGMQDSGLNGDLVFFVGQIEFNMLVCVLFCFLDFNGKWEIYVVGLILVVEKM